MALGLSETAPSDGAFAYGGYPDVDELYRQQAVETNAGKRGVLLQQIQQTLHERRRFAVLQIVENRNSQAPHLEYVAEAFSGDQPRARPLQLDDCIGRDR